MNSRETVERTPLDPSYSFIQTHKLTGPDGNSWAV
jgi:hypothetical protein